MSYARRETYQDIVEHLTDGVILLDPQARCLYVNPSAERIIERSVHDAAGKCFWEAAPTAIGTAFRQSFEQNGRGKHVVFLRHHFANGSWYEARASPTRDRSILISFRDITDRLQAEAARRENEKRFQLLVAGIQDYAIFMLDLKGSVTTWNQGAERIKGYRAEEIIGRHFSIFFSAEEVANDKPTYLLKRAIAEGHVEDEGWRVKKDGSRFYASVVLSAVYDELGEPIGFAKITRDVTERRQTQEALGRSEAKFAGIISISSDAIISIDEAQRITLFNDGAEHIFGYARRDVIGQPMDILIPERFRSDHRQHVASFANGPTTARGMGERKEVFGRRSNGEEFPADAAISKLRIDDQPLTLTVVLRDVTTRHQAEDRLRASEERLRLTLEAGEIGAWRHCPTTGETTWDDRCRALFGLPPDAQVSYSLFLDAIHLADRQRVEERVRKMLEYQRGNLEYEDEYRVIGIGDGVERWVAVRGKVFFDEQQRPKEVLGVLRDITNQKGVEELRERLLGIVGHDLRNPLNSIKMGANLLSKVVPPDDRRMVDIIARSAERMNRMIHQLLDFTRVRFAAGISLERESFDLAELCRDLVPELELANPGRTVRLAVVGNCTGLWDRSRMAEVLSNLLANALQHGSPFAPVEVVLLESGAEVVIEVCNQGTPIPAEMLPHLFDPFCRGSPGQRPAAGASAGMGLGLYISKEIVVAHGGKIDIQSGAAGTTFTVRVPRGQLKSLDAHP